MERQCGAACGQQGVPAFLSGSARVSCPAVESDIKLPDTQKIIYTAGDGPRWQRLVLGRKGQMHGNEMIYIIEEPLVDDGSGSEKSFFCRLEQKLDETILKKMGEPIGETPSLGPWRSFLERRHKATEIVNIGLVGKYDLQDAYKSILESLSQAGTYNDYKVKATFINSEKLNEQNVAEKLAGMDGIVICPGFGQRGIEGKIVAAHYTRTHDIPTFGICLGMQMMVIEFGRNVLGYEDANSREMDEKTSYNVIDIMEDQKNITNMGGTMRLGAYECVLKQGSRVFNIYNSEHIQERHRHRYEFNNDFEQEYERAGMKCVGRNPESDLVEIVEIPGLKWYIGTQFHPEYSSTVLHPHPLFLDFVKTAIENKNNKNK